MTDKKDEKATKVLDLERLEILDSGHLEILTGTKASTWRYWASIGEGPASFKLGRRRVWKRATVEAWLAEQQLTDATT